MASCKGLVIPPDVVDTVVLYRMLMNVNSSTVTST